MADCRWGLEEIRSHDPGRAARLENAGSSCDLIDRIVDELRRSIDEGSVRYAVDSIENRFELCRITAQFRVAPNIYDWFFNGPTGYRAQYLASAESGHSYNSSLVARLRDEFQARISAMQPAYLVRVEINGCSRSETVERTAELSLKKIYDSLCPQVSKIWICERLYIEAASAPKHIGAALLIDAAKSGPKLSISKWKAARNPKSGEIGEGLRAPIPEQADYSWLDLKGGFVTPDGTVRQLKDPAARSKALNERGWT